MPANVYFFAGKAGPVTAWIVYRDNNLRMTRIEVENTGPRACHISVSFKGEPVDEITVAANDTWERNVPNAPRWSMVENEEGELQPPPGFDYTLRWGAIG